MRILGLDIGGANLKAAASDGRCVSRPFAVWKHSQQLAHELAKIVAEFEPVDLVAMTTTAELADCFATKAEGVEHVVRAVECAAGDKPVFVWQTAGEFVDPQTAREFPMLTAAANWHALATWAARIAEASAILIDVGSTTTDIIPIQHGQPIPRGLTDRERLQSGELVYSGVWRTPLCAIAHSVPFRDGYCPLAAELFATMLDVYLMLGEIPEDPSQHETANGRPATKAAAHDRIARSLCCDRTELTCEEAEQVAKFLADVQRQRIRGALDRVLRSLGSPCRSVLISGSGDFLAARIVAEHPQLKTAEILRLADQSGPDASHAACAFAIARLAEERIVAPT